MALALSSAGGAGRQCDAPLARRAIRVRPPTYRGAVRELFHVALPEEWAAAQQAGQVTDSTRGRTLEQDGYVHCSYAEQVAGVASRFYADLAAIVVLRIDPARLSSPVVEEDLVGSGEPFPHVYGPIDLAAVVEARTTSPLDIGV
jgi:glutathione S-transferase